MGFNPLGFINVIVSLILSVLSFPATVITRTDHGERYISPLRMPVAYIALLFIVGISTIFRLSATRFSGVAERIGAEDAFARSSQIWILFFIISVGCWLYEWLSVQERERNGVFILSEFIGRPRFFPAEKWAMLISPGLFVVFGIWDLAVFRIAPDFAFYLIASGLVQYFELLRISYMTRQLVLDKRDGGLMGPILDDADKERVEAASHDPDEAPSTGDLIAAFTPIYDNR